MSTASAPQQNIRITSFTDGSIQFNATAAGVYMESGSADGSEVNQQRIRKLANGVKVSADGTGRLPTWPPLVVANIVFVSSNPAGHTQYKNLMRLKGAYGTLNGGIAGSANYTAYYAPAILVAATGNWKAPYAAGIQNTLIIAAHFELMEDWLEVV